MSKLITAIAAAFALSSTAVLAQTTPPKAPTATPSTTAPSTMAPAVDAKFKAADKDNNGVLSGAELGTYRADLTKIDANKDGSISRDEFASASKSGVIK